VVILLLVIIGASCLMFFSTRYSSSDFSKHKSYWEVLQFSLNTHADADTILKNRLPLWHAALNMVVNQPWVGIGIGSYPFWLEFFKGENVTTFLKIAHAHNYFLEIGAELGLIGLGLYLWLLFLIFKTGWDATRRFGLLPFGLLTGILAFLLALLTQHALVQIEMQFLFWIPVALLVNYTGSTRQDARCPIQDAPSEPQIPNPKFQTLKHYTAIGMFILFLFCVYIYNYITPDKMKNLVDNSVGMYKAESNSGYTFRWINRIAYKKVVIRGRSFTLPILVYHSDLNQNPVNLQLYLNNDLLDNLNLTQPGWSEHQYTVPASIPTSPDGTNNAVLSITVDRTWNPWQKKAGAASFWDYRRLGVGIARLRWTTPLPPVDQLALDLGTPKARPYLALGWYADELSGDKKSSFIWSQGAVSQIYLPLIPGKNYELYLRLLPFVYPNAPTQSVKISLNNQLLQSYTLQNDWTWQEITVQIPSTVLTTTVNILNLEYSRINAPKEVIPNSIDPREIAVACDSVIVKSK
jgi:hypothetical protein